MKDTWFVSTLDELAEALHCSRNVCKDMKASGIYDRAIHHLIGNKFIYNVDLILEISRMSNENKRK